MTPLALLLGAAGVGAVLLLAGGRSPGPTPPAISTLHPPLPGQPRISSRFGWREDPVHGGRAFHAGIDLPVPVGTPVHAPWDGEVLRIDVDGVGKGVINGNAVILGVSPWRWAFLHLSRVVVPVGARVRRGAVLGFSGNTGKSTGPHLHLQVFDAAGHPTDPEAFFPPSTFKNPRKR